MTECGSTGLEFKGHVSGTSPKCDSKYSYRIQIQFHPIPPKQEIPNIHPFRISPPQTYSREKKKKKKTKRRTRGTRNAPGYTRKQHRRVSRSDLGRRIQTEILRIRTQTNPKPYQKRKPIFFFIKNEKKEKEKHMSKTGNKTETQRNPGEKRRGKQQRKIPESTCRRRPCASNSY